VLSKQAKDALDEIATQLKNQHGYVIEVQGFSSGQRQAAIANSRKMADSVVRYLVLNHEIPAYRIYVIGMGNAPVAKRTSGTRVEISLLKNDLEQTAQGMKNGVSTYKEAWILAGAHGAHLAHRILNTERRGGERSLQPQVHGSRLSEVRRRYSTCRPSARSLLHRTDLAKT
jgi:hypothetical protein